MDGTLTHSCPRAEEVLLGSLWLPGNTIWTSLKDGGEAAPPLTSSYPLSWGSWQECGATSQDFRVLNGLRGRASLSSR